MVKLTITHEDGRSYEFENIIAYDFFDKEFAEAIAKRELSDEEAENIKLECDYLNSVTNESVEEVIHNIIGE